MEHKITLIGDVHGKFKEYQKLIDSIENPTIQVGDFGVGFAVGQEQLVCLLI